MCMPWYQDPVQTYTLAYTHPKLLTPPNEGVKYSRLLCKGVHIHKYISTCVCAHTNTPT